MSIVSGYKKFKKYILTSSGFQLVSHWTKANTLEFDDGKTAQDKLGAIDGISSSRESNSDKIAASTALVSELNSDLTALNDAGAIQGMEVREGDGVYITYTDGADTVSKKLGSYEVVLDTSNNWGVSGNSPTASFTAPVKNGYEAIHVVPVCTGTRANSYGGGSANQGLKISTGTKSASITITTTYLDNNSANGYWIIIYREL